MVPQRNTSPSHRDALVVDRVEVRVATVPLRRPIVSNVGVYKEWPFILVDLMTRQGVVGRSYLEPYVLNSAKFIVPAIEALANSLIGKPVAPIRNFEQAVNLLHLHGRQGLSLIAAAAMDMALWDALAKSAGVPLAVLLGGTIEPVRAYNTNGLWLIPLERIAAEARELVEEGKFSAIKIRLGRQTLKDDLTALSEVRNTIGDEVKLMADFNQCMTFAEALHRLHALDDQDLYWFEEPIVFDNYDGCAQLARELKTPLQIGENIYGPRDFYLAVKTQASDFYMPDLMRIGGVTGFLKCAAIAGAAGLPLSNHLYPEFSAHLLNVCETADWLEWRDWGNPLLKDPFEVKDGFLVIPDRLGAGIDWDEKAVQRYRAS
jgi:mandelate racemase